MNLFYSRRFQQTGDPSTQNKTEKEMRIKNK